MKGNALAFKERPRFKFRNWPIKIKILSSLFLASLLPIPIILFIFHNTYKMETYFNDVVSYSFPQLGALTELKNAASQIQDLTTNFVLQTGESTQLEGSRAANLKFDLLARMAELDKWLDAYMKDYPDKSSQVITRLRKYKDDITLSALDVMEAYENNAPPQKIAQNKATLEHIQSEFATQISNIISNETRTLNQQSQLLSENISHNFISALFFLFLSIVVSILISLTLARLISAPIINLYHFALSVRNVDKPSKAKIWSMDEIGLLGKSINRMIERLSRISESERLAKEQLNLQYAILQVLSHTSNLEDGASGILRLLRTNLNYKAGLLLVLEKKKDELENEEEPNRMLLFSEDNPEISHPLLEKIFSDLTFETHDAFIKQLEEKIPSSWKLEMPFIHPFILIQEAHPYGAGICCPVIAQEQELQGYLIIFSENTHEFDNVLLNNICSQISTFFQQIDAREKILSLNKAIINSAHQAGMAEMGVSVLHNIGNVLNSINVSAEQLDTTLQNKDFNDLKTIITCMEENEATLGTFFRDHHKGKHTLHYLNLIQAQWEKDNEAMCNEMHIFKNNIGHIKSVITEHQSIFKTSGYKELVILPESIDDILAMHRNMLNTLSIQVSINIEIQEPLFIYRIKFEQILINLIRNSIDSLNEVDWEKKILDIHAWQEGNMAIIRIMDNGSGIEEAELQKVFRFGFTTKEYGHGFGLHSSALIAREMGGSLRLSSRGKGCGATAILTIPMKAQE